MSIALQNIGLFFLNRLSGAVLPTLLWAQPTARQDMGNKATVNSEEKIVVKTVGGHEIYNKSSKYNISGSSCQVTQNMKERGLQQNEQMRFAINEVMEHHSNQERQLQYYDSPRRMLKPNY